MELGARVSEALLTCAEGAEVLSGLGDGIVVEGEIDAAGLVCSGISGSLKQLMWPRRDEWQLEGQVGWGKHASRTFDLFGGTSALHDWSMPGDIEIGFNGHCCW